MRAHLRDIANGPLAGRPTGGRGVKSVASLSIVVAAMSRIDLLERTLVSVLAHRPDAAEVIVVLDKQYDDPYQLDGEVRFVSAGKRSSLPRCLNVGIEAAEADIVHTLACGAEVEEGWTAKAMRRFADPKVAAVAPAVHAKDGRMISAGLSYQRSGSHVPVHADSGYDELRAPSFHGGFYRKSAIEQLGEPMAECIGAFADVDLGLRLHHVGYDVICEGESRIMVHDDMCEPSMSRFHRGRSAERLFWRNAPMMGWIPSLAAHIGKIADECVSGMTRPHQLMGVAGRLLALGEYPSYVRHWRQLLQLHEFVQRSLEEGNVQLADADRLRSAA
jgi:GT2 family glycosyltransferase